MHSLTLCITLLSIVAIMFYITVLMYSYTQTMSPYTVTAFHVSSITILSAQILIHGEL